MPTLKEIEAQASYATLAEPPPMFPSHIHFGGVSIKVFANGTWEGDRNAFIKALEDAKQHGSAINMPMLWLIANAMLRTPQ